MVASRLLYPGSVFDVWVVEEDGDCQVSTFISGLLSPDLAQMIRLIEFLNSQGIPRNEEKFRNEGDDIYALKTKNSRVYGFFDGRKRFTLALGFMKNAGGRRVERRFHERAIEIRQALREGG